MASPLRIALAAHVLLAGALLQSQQAAREQPGPLPAGGQLLPNGWRVTPAGEQTPLGQFPISAALSPDGKHLLVLEAGERPAIRVIETAARRVTGTVPVADAWLGLAFSPNGDRLYAGGGARAAILEFTFANGALAPARTFEIVSSAARTDRDFIGDVAISPDGRLLYAADLFRDSVVVVNPQSGMTINRVKTGRRPYRILFHPDGRSFFVSHWADGSIGHYDTATGSPLGVVRLGGHPTDLLWRSGGPAEVEPGQPTFAGRLFVAAANTNNVYTVAVSQSKELKPIESINVAMSPHQPLGMTPSALALSPDEARIFAACSDANVVAVVNVTGERSYVEGFIPTGWYPTAIRALPSGALAVINAKSGTASWIDSFTLRQLETWTKSAESNSAYHDTKLLETVSLPPIQHIIYILGGRTSGANWQRLGREFVLLDNFHALGDSAAGRYAWATSAIAPDFVQKLAFRKPLDPEALDPASLPPAGYLWTNAGMAGVTMRNYGFMMGEKGVRDPVLARVSNAGFRGSDVERSNVFLADLAGYQKAGDMPRLTLIRLDDGDAALGTIVEAITKSRFWNSAAIFAAPTGDGPALVISPFARRKSVDSSMYSSVSMLRTIELLLGLRPMTQFDAGARPITAAFQAQPDFSPYAAEKL